ncbi:MAG: hypothetical protein M1401_20730, partial [Chloroflexi bacterium]|nr:hypothetical protein [Chloroflexota bacterium]
MAFDQNNYVAAWGSGWVVLVNGVWYRPGCLAASSAYPPPTSAVWSDLTAAQTCYNQKHGGDETTPSKPPSTFGAWLQQNILGPP